MNTLSRSAMLIALVLALGVSFTFAQPTITALSVQSRPAGGSFTITGTNFNATAASDIVRIGGVKASVTAASTTSLTVTVPNNATGGLVSVTVLPAQLQATWGVPFNVTFTFTGPIDTNSFAAPVGYASEASTANAFTGDFDGDGKIDIGVTNNGSSLISLFLNTSTPGTINSGSFAPKFTLTPGIFPWGTAVADIDGDGKLDIVVCNGFDSTVSVFRNTSTPGTLSFDPRVTFKSGYGPHDVVVADFNHDGKPDLIVTNYGGGLPGQGSISIFKNITTGSTIAFTKHVDVAVDDGPRGLAVADINGDGWLDIAVACFDAQSIKVFENQSRMVTSTDSIAMIEQTTLSGFLAPDAVALTDIDGDGVPDVVAANGGDAVWMYRGDSNFGYEGAVLYHKGSGAGTVIGADVNGDGRPDVVTGNALESSFRAGSISVLLNAGAGSGTFTSATLRDSVSYVMPSLAYTAVVADVDGDGRPDLIGPAYYSQFLEVLRSRINDTYTITPSTGGPGSGTISPAAAFVIRHGHDTTFTFTPGGGNHVDSVVVDGVNKFVLPSYTFKNVTGPHTIKAYFSTGSVFAITSSAGANGSIVPLGTIGVPPGGSQAYTITPNAGFGIDSLIVDNVRQATAGTYTFTNVQAAHSIRATFTTGVTLPLTVFLQGPAATPGDSMVTALKATGTLAAHFGAAPIPSLAVDSINVELRSAQTAAGSTTRKFRPAWVLKDGSIRDFSDTTKSFVQFDTTGGSYYIVVRHRNHLAVMSAAAVAMTSSTPLYDFTTGQAKAFGTLPMIQVGTRFCLYAGDGSGDGQITTLDFSPWLANAKAAITGYSITDYNCDGQNTTSDFTEWLVNAKNAATSQVP